MKRFILDTFLCTAFIFGLMGVFASVTFFKAFDLFDPIGDMFGDFELTDLVFSQLQDDPIADDRIVIVNFGVIPREGIAREIEILNKYEPRVIGLDATFAHGRPWEVDSALVRVLSETDNIVLAQDLQFDYETGEAITPLRPPMHIMQDNHLGFVDLLTNAESQEDLKMCRDFLTKQQVDGEMQYAFSVKMAMAADSATTKKFLIEAMLLRPSTTKAMYLASSHLSTA